MLPVEAGVMKPDPVYIRQRIPKLQLMIQEQMMLFEGQVYMIESSQPQGIVNAMKSFARQAFVHYAIIFQNLEQLRESIEAVNGAPDYYFQIYNGWKAEKPLGWNAYEKFQQSIQGDLEQVCMTMWKEKMQQLGVNTANRGGVSDLTGDVPRGTPEPVKSLAAVSIAKKPSRAIPESQVPKNYPEVDARDFKAPPKITVTNEMRGHLPAQAFEAQVEQEADRAEEETIVDKALDAAGFPKSTEYKSQKDLLKRKLALLEELEALDQEEVEVEVEPKPAKPVKRAARVTPKGKSKAKVGVSDL